jgi:hypothetical protein
MERWAFCFLGGKNRTKIGVRRYHDAVLLKGSCENFLVSFRMHSVGSNMHRIMSSCHKEIG